MDRIERLWNEVICPMCYRLNPQHATADNGVGCKTCEGKELWCKPQPVSDTSLLLTEEEKNQWTKEIARTIYTKLGHYDIVSDTWEESTQARTDIMWGIAVAVRKLIIAKAEPLIRKKERTKILRVGWSTFLKELERELDEECFPKRLKGDQTKK